MNEKRDAGEPLEGVRGNEQHQEEADFSLPLKELNFDGDYAYKAIYSNGQQIAVSHKCVFSKQKTGNWKYCQN
jgi:hypothetical protein